MSLDAALSDSPVLSSEDELVAWLARAERPNGPGLVGLEHEKLLFRGSDGGPVPYEGPTGVGAVFEGLARLGWQPYREEPQLPVIAATRGQATLSLEPGGQFELSGAPQTTAQAAHQENLVHLDELGRVAGPLGLGGATLGYRPFGTLADQPWMPKRRYSVMRDSLGARGALAHHMMLMTATGQVSLDWQSEADCARKLTLAARAAPLFVALFANSPLMEGRPTGFLSWRSRVWTQVDPARTGYPPGYVDGTFSYRGYVQWAVEAPLLFLRRGGQYLTPRLRFKDLLAHGFEGQPARESDWVDHLSTLFPEVRLKRVLEFRSADACSPAMTGGLAAALRGLLYAPTALGDGLALLPARSAAEHQELHTLAAREGLAGRWQGRALGGWVGELLAIARQGLVALGDDAPSLLEPLVEVAATGQSPAVHVLAAPRDQARLMRALSLWPITASS